MGDGLQSAGHHMDTWVKIFLVEHDRLNNSPNLCTMFVHRYAASIDDILEEEEHYADQLKEYLFYTDSVR